MSLGPMPQAGGKIVRKGLDFFWEQSVTGPTAGAPKALPGSRPAGSIGGGGAKAASTPQGS
jgi:hypothetical protein